MRFLSFSKCFRSFSDLSDVSCFVFECFGVFGVVLSCSVFLSFSEFFGVFHIGAEFSELVGVVSRVFEELCRSCAGGFWSVSEFCVGFCRVSGVFYEVFPRFNVSPLQQFNMLIPCSQRFNVPTFQHFGSLLVEVPLPSPPSIRESGYYSSSRGNLGRSGLL